MVEALRKFIPFRHLQDDIRDRQAVLTSLPQADFELRRAMTILVNSIKFGKLPDPKTLPEDVPVKGDVLLLSGPSVYILHPTREKTWHDWFPGSSHRQKFSLRRLASEGMQKRQQQETPPSNFSPKS